MVGFHAWSVLFGACLGAGDRPEIKNDAGDTINSDNMTEEASAFAETRVGGLRKVEGHAFWATCNWLEGKSTKDKMRGSDLVWLQDGTKPDSTFHGLKVASESVEDFNGLNDVCTTKQMHIVKMTPGAFKSKPDLKKFPKSIHTKYIVPAEQEPVFLDAVNEMLGTLERRDVNMLPAETLGNGHKVAFGYLMVLAADNDKQNPSSHTYWHIVQFFEEAKTLPNDMTVPDKYDLFSTARSKSTMKQKQWIKLSNLMNQRTLNLRPTISFGNDRDFNDESKKHAAEWLTCSHLPVPQKNKELSTHFIESTPQSGGKNYHVLQFAETRDGMEIYPNCRVQSLDIIHEGGNFILEETDLVMHMEYEVSMETPTVEDGEVSFRAAVEDLFKMVLGLPTKDGSTYQAELKYMIVLKSQGNWNEKDSWHIYQTFENPEDFNRHQKGAALKAADSPSPLGRFLFNRKEAPAAHKWMKMDSTVNGPSPVLHTLNDV